MNYEEMSDFKINLKVANLVRDKWLNISRLELLVVVVAWTLILTYWLGW